MDPGVVRIEFEATGQGLDTGLDLLLAQVGHGRQQVEGGIAALFAQRPTRFRQGLIEALLLQIAQGELRMVVAVCTAVGVVDDEGSEESQAGE